MTGPFLTVPVLTRVWPTLEAVDKPTREGLADALADAPTDPPGWIRWVQTGLLGWGDALDDSPEFDLPVAEYDQTVTRGAGRAGPGTGPGAGRNPADPRCPPRAGPTAPAGTLAEAAAEPAGSSGNNRGSGFPVDSTLHPVHLADWHDHNRSPGSAQSGSAPYEQPAPYRCAEQLVTRT